MKQPPLGGELSQSHMPALQSTPVLQSPGPEQQPAPEQTQALPDFMNPLLQVKSHAPLALQVLVPFAGGVQAVQLADVKQPLSGVLPTQLPLHRCCGWVHELPLEDEPLGPEPPVEGLPPISVVLIDVLPPFEFVDGPEPPFDV